MYGNRTKSFCGCNVCLLYRIYGPCCVEDMKTIVFFLTRKWFDLVASGRKTSEYRQVKPFWTRQLKDAKPGDCIIFRRGYSHVETVRTLAGVSIVEGWQLPEAEREFFGPCNDIKFYKIDFKRS